DTMGEGASEGLLPRSVTAGETLHEGDVREDAIVQTLEELERSFLTPRVDIDLQDVVIGLQVREVGETERALARVARLLLLDVVAREVAVLGDVVARRRCLRALIGHDGRR